MDLHMGLQLPSMGCSNPFKLKAKIRRLLLIPLIREIVAKIEGELERLVDVVRTEVNGKDTRVFLWGE